MSSTHCRLQVPETVQQYRSKFQGRPPPTDSVNTRSVTIKQLIEATQQTKQKGRFILNNQLLYNVRICGRIVTIDQEENHTNYVLDDGTGRLNARIWSMGADENTDLSGACLESYYMVVGTVVNDNIWLLLQTIRATKVIDHNQVTMHLLEAIHQHCLLESRTSQDTARWEKARKEASQDIRIHLAPELDKEAIIELLSNETIRKLEDGATSAFIIKQLQMDEATGRETLQCLLNEGSIYNTKDYDHFKLADNN